MFYEQAKAMSQRLLSGEQPVYFKFLDEYDTFSVKGCLRAGLALLRHFLS